MVRKNDIKGDEATTRDMPLDLLMDLLVDGELNDGQRAEMMRRLEIGDPAVSAQWKALALRFLQGQVEKETVRQLMAGGALVPVEFSAVPPGRDGFKFPLMRWMRSTTVMASAAALLIAAISAVITLYVVREPVRGQNQSAQYYTVKVSGDSVGYPGTIPVSVLRNTPAAKLELFPMENAADPDKSEWRQVVIQKDESGNAVVIPVNAMRVKVY